MRSGPAGLHRTAKPSVCLPFSKALCGRGGPVVDSELELKLWVSLLIAIIVAIPILIAILEQNVNAKRKLEQERLESLLVSDITRTLKNASTSALEDVDDLYLSIWSQNKIGLDGRSTILSALRKAKRGIALEANAGSEKYKGYLEQCNKLLLSAEKAFEVESKKAPFAGVDDPERGLLQDILEASSGASKEIYIFSKLEDLAGAINLRDRESKKYIDEQKESLKLSRRGLWATVVFSLLSIALAVYFYVNDASA
jgi:hypothetical protein